MTSCWSCHKDPGRAYFCIHCQKIQPILGKDYFAFLGIPRSIDLDLGALEKIFYDLSRKLHPDFFHGRDFKEKVLSIENTTFLNKAYNTLKDPVTRAEYLLDLEVPGDPKERTKIDTVLVTEIFEVQEKVEEEGRTKDPALRAELESAQKEVEGKIAARRKTLEAYFKEWDALGDNPAKKQELAKTIRRTVDEITYLKNLIQSIQTGGQIRH